MRIDVASPVGENPMPYLGRTYCPEIIEASLNLSKVVYEKSKLPLGVFEAARYRTAQINGCVACQNFRSARDVPGYLASLNADKEASVVGNGQDRKSVV